MFNNFFPPGHPMNHYYPPAVAKKPNCPKEGYTDQGPSPYVTDINTASICNKNYRTALWTGRHLQTTLMSIPAGSDIGLEVHPHVDQFLRIEQGQGISQMGPSKNNLNYQKPVNDNTAVFVPAGTWHNVTNTGKMPLKLYSIYSPPNHPRGTIDITKAAADAREAAMGIS